MYAPPSLRDSAQRHEELEHSRGAFRASPPDHGDRKSHAGHCEANSEAGGRDGFKGSESAMRDPSKRALRQQEEKRQPKRTLHDQIPVGVARWRRLRWVSARCPIEIDGGDKNEQPRQSSSARY